jgi:hypothetical protein
METGQHYCVRLVLGYENFVLVETYKGSLDSIDCGVAKTEALDAKPLDLKHVEKSARNLLLPTASPF